MRERTARRTLKNRTGGLPSRLALLPTAEHGSSSSKPVPVDATVVLVTVIAVPVVLAVELMATELAGAQTLVLSADQPVRPAWAAGLRRRDRRELGGTGDINASNTSERDRRARD
jgi:hypothetical protein